LNQTFAAHGDFGFQMSESEGGHKGYPRVPTTAHQRLERKISSRVSDGKQIVEKRSGDTLPPRHGIDNQFEKANLSLALIPQGRLGQPDQLTVAFGHPEVLAPVILRKLGEPLPVGEWNRAKPRFYRTRSRIESNDSFGVGIFKAAYVDRIRHGLGRAFKRAGRR
jgi:hypothetical protein